MAVVDAIPGLRRCNQCGTLFQCGAGGLEPCWCARLPPLPAGCLVDGGCVCETCLRARLQQAESAR